MGIDRENCESCQILIEKYGEDKLEICEHCNHYYYIQCNCSSAEKEMEEIHDEVELEELRERNWKSHFSPKNCYTNIINKDEVHDIIEQLIRAKNIPINKKTQLTIDVIMFALQSGSYTVDSYINEKNSLHDIGINYIGDFIFYPHDIFSGDEYVHNFIQFTSLFKNIMESIQEIIKKENEQLYVVSFTPSNGSPLYNAIISSRLIPREIIRYMKKFIKLDDICII